MPICEGVVEGISACVCVRVRGLPTLRLWLLTPKNILCPQGICSDLEMNVGDMREFLTETELRWDKLDFVPGLQLRDSAELAR